jgi:hypothetical protein
MVSVQQDIVTFIVHCTVQTFRYMYVTKTDYLGTHLQKVFSLACQFTVFLAENLKQKHIVCRN